MHMCTPASFGGLLEPLGVVKLVRAVYAAPEHCAHVNLVEQVLRRVEHEAVFSRQLVRGDLQYNTKFIHNIHIGYISAASNSLNLASQSSNQIVHFY